MSGEESRARGCHGTFDLRSRSLIITSCRR